jgi:hypothetical protein
MRPPTHLRFVEKAAAAMTSAVEVYNKPSFSYREETFSILSINAWELLLKAKVLKDAANDLKALRVYEPRKTKSGKLSKKLYLKRNRAGNALSVSLAACLAALEKTAAKVPSEAKLNLVALMAIRDNSVHYVTASAVLSRQAQELASACVRNFVLLAKRWFSRDLSQSLSLVLPLSFVTGAAEVESVVVSPDESRLIKYLQQLAHSETDATSDFAVAVRLHVKVEKSRLATASKVQISKDADAVKIVMSEQDVRDKYPWDYAELCGRLKTRYSDFKQDKRFHAVRKGLLGDEKYHLPRFLDPGNPRSPRKDFYNSNVLLEFDKHYVKAELKA